MDEDDEGTLIGYGCPACLSLHGVERIPSACPSCGLAVRPDSAALLGFLELDAGEGEAVTLTVSIVPWLRGEWSHEAEAAIREAFAVWRSDMLARL